MKLKGSEILIQCLLEQKVDTIFGFPGGKVIEIYDALYNEPKIKHVLTAHEQGAAHAADGYARSTGKTGVCLATSGPGATNLVTGIATAYLDSVPMVAITGNVPTHLLGKDAFQEVDIAGVTEPITKHNYIVKDIEKLATIIREAFYIANEGRPGPVLIDIPSDILTNSTNYEPNHTKNEIAQEIKTKAMALDASSFHHTIELIKASKKPFILAGGGIVISGASNELVAFAEKIDAPVATTLMCTDSFPDTHPLATGMIGMHGTKTSNIGISTCDLLIAIGTRFSDRVTGKLNAFAKQSKIIHIDIDPVEINKNVLCTTSLIGDAKEILKALTLKLMPQKHDDWLSTIQQMKLDYPLKYDDTLNAQYVFETLSQITNEDTIITTDVGQHQMWTALHYHFKKSRTFISSGGAGTMGYGVGAGIGAQFGNPDRMVITITGDGSFGMNMNELATIAKNKLPIKIILIDNQSLGMVRQWQTLFYDERYSATDLIPCVDYLQLAKAFGIKGFELTNKNTTKNILQDALSHNGPALIHCKIHPDDKVFPMVPQGKGLKDVITE